MRSDVCLLWKGLVRSTVYCLCRISRPVVCSPVSVVRRAFVLVFFYTLACKHHENCACSVVLVFMSRHRETGLTMCGTVQWDWRIYRSSVPQNLWAWWLLMFSRRTRTTVHTQRRNQSCKWSSSTYYIDSSVRVHKN